MNDYNHFEVEDFLTDEFFIEWVKTPNPQNSKFWNDWLQAHPQQASKIEIATATIKAFTYHTPHVPASFYTDLKKDIDNTIINSKPQIKLSALRGLRTWMRVAAIFIGIAIFSSLLYVFMKPPATIKVVTAYKQVKRFELPDHSLVTLNANSSLEYSKDWKNDKREVTLKGEGFFAVKHINQQNGAAKFTVLANNVNVQVLGTEFNVNSREDVTAVMLQSGKVQLQANGLKGSRLMKPNDLIVFNSKTKHLDSKVVNPTYYTAWLNRRYIFSDVKLEEVCKQLGNYYGLQFIIQNNQLASQTITGTLLLEDEKSLLQTLSSILDANVQQHGSQIIISSK